MSIAMSPALQRLIASVFLYIVMGLMAGWVAIVQNLPAEFGGFDTGLTSTQDFFYGMGTALSPPFYALVIQLGLLLLALRKDGWGTAGVLGLTIMGLMTCFGALGEPINRQIFNPATFDPLKAFLMAGMILIPIGIVAFGLMEWQSRRKESA